jgi:hypothetical protein
MTKAKTMLDELARVLKARKYAIQRTDRRADALDAGWTQRGRDLFRQARDLENSLDDRAVMEYDRLLRSNPGRRDMQKAFRMMPPSLVREHDYFDR